MEAIAETHHLSSGNVHDIGGAARIYLSYLDRSLGVEDVNLAYKMLVIYVAEVIFSSISASDVPGFCGNVNTQQISGEIKAFLGDMDGRFNDQFFCKFFIDVVAEVLRMFAENIYKLRLLDCLSADARKCVIVVLTGIDSSANGHLRVPPSFTFDAMGSEKDRYLAFRTNFLLGKKNRRETATRFYDVLAEKCGLNVEIEIDDVIDEIIDGGYDKARINLKATLGNTFSYQYPKDICPFVIVEGEAPNTIKLVLNWREPKS
ncbi:MAG: hypothetical protein US89_C0006G0023 [Candidatus Peregrinibacteria bacterium GW2011_GWF2_38_29]|nr:MAG: hypothetical protein US89_C0006G0023 [Candidatus Peregrinibacteria bacterium GW2011_GWF2_38_29]HBB03213.1 hypothetical protein [Candidatus Peregrinibacteria bacterium]